MPVHVFNFISKPHTKIDVNSSIFLMGKLGFRKVNLTIVSYVLGNRARIQELLELYFMLLKSKKYFVFG